MLNLDLKPFIGPLTDAIRAEAVKFNTNPKQARDGFDSVFDALEQTLQAVDGELASFGNLDFQAGCSTQTTAILRDFASGKFLVDLRRAKYRCSKLYEVYVTYIKTYVDNVLNPTSAAQLQRSFELLKTSDYSVVERLEEIDSTITRAANGMLSACNSGDIDGARGQFKSIEPYITTARKQLREDLAELSDARGALNEWLGVPFRPDVARIARRFRIPLSIIVLAVLLSAAVWGFASYSAKKWYLTQQGTASATGSRLVIGGPFSGRDQCRLELLRAIQIGAQLRALQCAQYPPHLQVGDQI